MAKKRYISTEFWRDDFVDNLDANEKLLFLYLICNPATNLCGIYQLPLRIISSDTDIPMDKLGPMFQKFSGDGKAYYIQGWVILPNALKHQQFKNPKIIEGIKRELEEEVSKEILDEINRLCIDYKYPMDSLVKLSKSKVKVEVKYKDEDTKKAKLLYELIKERNPAWYVVPNWDDWSDDIRKIREIDGRTEEQIDFIIRWAQNDNFWQGNILSPFKLRKQFNTLVVQARAKGNKGMVVL